MTDKLKLLDDLLLGASWSDEEAIIIIALRREVLAEKSLAESIQAAKRLAEPELPPMVRIKPMKSIDVKCPTCKAKPGVKCFRLTSRGPYGKPTDEHMPNYHRSRVEVMKAENEGKVT